MTSNDPTIPNKPAVLGSALLAEDTASVQKLVALHLRRLGFEVSVANDGQEAIDILSRQAFDLVLMDVQMPVMDGMEATRILRERGYSGLIIALTAEISDDKIDACLAAGCNGHLGKPVTREMLASLLKTYLGKL